MRRYIEKHIEDKLAEVILENYHSNLTGISLSACDGDIVVEYI